MVGAEDFLQNLHRAAIKRLGRPIFPLRAIELGEVVKACADSGVIGSEGGFGDGEGAAVKRLSNAPLVEAGRDRRRRSLRDYRRTNSDQAADTVWNVQECPRMSGAIFAVKWLKNPC
jgi:hypothetical protein